jgi:uridine kinase
VLRGGGVRRRRGTFGAMARPIMVAVGGDSGTGKAALCAGLRTIFGEERVADVSLDGYFALNRTQRNAVELSPLDPRAHDFAAMDEDLFRLSRGNAVTKPVYDHVMGAISGTETVEPRSVVLVQGRFPLYTQVLRAFFDVSVWLEREPGLVLPWTIHRDAAEREGDERVHAAIERRRADYEKYIAPQAQYADLRARFTRNGATFTESGRPDLGVSSQADDATAHRLEDALRSEIRSFAPAGAERAGTYSGERAGSNSEAGGEQHSHALAIAQLLVARRIAAIAAKRTSDVVTT